MEDASIFGRSALFSGMKEEALAEALSFFRAKEAYYKKGEFLLRAGDKIERFGFVLSGKVQVFMDDIDGNRIIMANVAEGESFGESLCFLETPCSSIYIIAISDCKIMWLSTMGIQNWDGQASVHDIIMRFISLLAVRTLAMNDRIQVLSKKTIREKLHTFFSQCVKRYGKMTFEIDMDRSDMAAYLGTDRSALSRELANMQAEGLITYHKNSFSIITIKHFT